MYQTKKIINSYANMTSDTITYGELKALRILYGTYSDKSPHEAANEIIQLAERIKAERAVIAMEGGLNVQQQREGITEKD